MGCKHYQTLTYERCFCSGTKKKFRLCLLAFLLAGGNFSELNVCEFFRAYTSDRQDQIMTATWLITPAEKKSKTKKEVVGGVLLRWVEMRPDQNQNQAFRCCAHHPLSRHSETRARWTAPKLITLPKKHYSIDCNEDKPSKTTPIAGSQGDTTTVTFPWLPAIGVRFWMACVRCSQWSNAF